MGISQGCHVRNKYHRVSNVQERSSNIKMSRRACLTGINWSQSSRNNKSIANASGYAGRVLTRSVNAYIVSISNYLWFTARTQCYKIDRVETQPWEKKLTQTSPLRKVFHKEYLYWEFNFNLTVGHKIASNIFFLGFWQTNGCIVCLCKCVAVIHTSRGDI